MFDIETAAEDELWERRDELHQMRDILPLASDQRRIRIELIHIADALDASKHESER